MTAFVTGITEVVSGIFNALISGLSAMGNLIFTFGDTGAVSGVTGFGWIVILMISVPLATGLFNAILGMVRSLGGRGGRRNGARVG